MTSGKSIARRPVGALKALALCALLAAPAAADIGLAARFGDVVLEGAAPGRVYNLREQLRLPFAIENRGDSETEITVEFLLPPKHGLAPGYEAVPDPGWFRAIPAKMTVAPKALGYFDLLLTIPDDPALTGKHYQAIIKARSSDNGLFGLAIENKIRFSIGPGPETLQAEKKKKAMQKLDFDVTPQALYLQAVPMGTLYDVKKEQKKSLRVANYDAEDLGLQFSSEPWDSRLLPPEGYAAVPDPGWLVFKSSMVVVEGEAIKQVGFFLNVPDKPEYKGKKYAALIKTGLTTGFWLDAPVKVYFETQK